MKKKEKDSIIDRAWYTTKMIIMFTFIILWVILFFPALVVWPIYSTSSLVNPLEKDMFN